MSLFFASYPGLGTYKCDPEIHRMEADSNLVRILLGFITKVCWGGGGGGGGGGTTVFCIINKHIQHS